MNNNSPRHISLIPILEVDSNIQSRVRDIRNEDAVRKWMYTDHFISEDEHLAWLDQLRIDSKQRVFVVLNEDNNPLGAVSVNALDRRHRKSDWAFYLTSTSRGGMGAALEFAFIDFVFDTLALEKLNCEVLEGNDSVVKLHKKFGFVEEGFRRSNIIKEGRRIGVHLLGLLNCEWRTSRQAIYDKYKSRFDQFTFSISFNRE
ncbi:MULTISPECIES: UDP-4-amino-4,6-dideoxy-N-acetyl-beta-L-altrosamine N-acetyltransferase [Pirellulaceae]|nr:MULTISPECIES: UDP-4-amino-4,6-dideoxy-N-acetyl-beta-L-altrosamine N-acetyltransferase [Pirellulaceae]